MSKHLAKNEEMELVEQSKQDYNAFNKLYEYYMPRIYGYLLSRVQNKEDAQDLTSQTFEKAIGGLMDFETRDNIRFSSWLYRIAINNLTDYYRRSGKRKNLDIKDYENKLSDGNSNQADEVANKDELSRYLEELPEESRRILMLKFYQDLGNHEISEVLSLSYSNVGVKLYRALKQLKEIIKQDE